jgi:hypothetical protein
MLFVGHFAIALAAKKTAPKISLGILFVACQALDLIWPVLVLIGVERVRVDHAATAFTPLHFEYYPWSHSLGMTVVWSLAALGIMRFARRSNREAGVVAAVVLSHWLLDLLAHQPDLPLWFGDGPALGMGLWNSVSATVIVELTIFAAAIWLYSKQMVTESKKDNWLFWGLIAFLTLTYFAVAFGPKPPVDAPASMIAGPALAFWILIPWAHWADKNRTERSG